MNILINQNGGSAVLEIFFMLTVSFVLGCFARIVYENFFLNKDFECGFYDKVEDQYQEDQEEIKYVDFSKAKNDIKIIKTDNEPSEQNNNVQEDIKKNNTDINEIKKDIVESSISPYLKIELEDLKIIDGVGPKIELLLKRNNILDLKTLSETSVEKLKEILATAGDRYAFHNPSSWPEQADLALKGNLNELTEFQDYLSARK